MDESTKRADLAARLAALERQHGDLMALFRAAHLLGVGEGRLSELRAVLAGLDGPPESEAEASANGHANESALVGARRTTGKARPGVAMTGG